MRQRARKATEKREREGENDIRHVLVSADVFIKASDCPPFHD